MLYKTLASIHTERMKSQDPTIQKIQLIKHCQKSLSLISAYLSLDCSDHLATSYNAKATTELATNQVARTK